MSIAPDKIPLRDILMLHASLHSFLKMAQSVLLVYAERITARMSEKTAFTSWNSRIAPVFDVAGRLFLVETEAGRILGETAEDLSADEPVEKVRRLARLGVNTLVCGAISRFLHAMVRSYGITVIPFVAGDLQEVIHAWIEGRLGDNFAMPGCCGRGRAARCRSMRQGGVSPRGAGTAENSGGTEAGRFPGYGRETGLGQSFSPGMENMCVCPGCGHCESNRMDVSCLHVQCPLCGSMMIRSTQ